jgi:DNA polymerase-3 subunit delta'
MPFRDVVGHGSLLQLIAQAVSRGTLPPSLGFVGPDGVGKQLAAMALAQAQNCLSLVQTRPFAVDACGECDSCKKIVRGSFSDLLLIETIENKPISIDQIRQVVHQVAYRPFEGRRRVVVINDADKMNTEAQSALLKTLEEPPDSSQFVLITSRPDLLLQTIRSRIQQMNFVHLSVDEVFQVVRGLGVENADAQLLAASGGSAGHAVALASGELVVARDAAVCLMEQVAIARDGRARLVAAKEFVGTKKKGQDVRRELIQRLRAMPSLLRDVALLWTGSEPQAMVNADLVDSLVPLSDIYGGSRGVEAFESVGRALDAAERHVNPKVVADWLACRL